MRSIHNLLQALLSLHRRQAGQKYSFSQPQRAMAPLCGMRSHAACTLCRLQPGVAAANECTVVLRAAQSSADTDDGNALPRGVATGLKGRHPRRTTTCADHGNADTDCFFNFKILLPLACRQCSVPAAVVKIAPTSPRPPFTRPAAVSCARPRVAVADRERGARTKTRRRPGHAEGQLPLQLVTPIIVAEFENAKDLHT